YNAMVQGGTGRAFFINPASSEEIVVALANGGSGEAPTGGVMVDVVPKDGGNRNAGYFLANYAGKKLQGDNIDDELRGRGLNTVTISHDFQFNCPCTLSLASATTALEAANESRWRSNMTQSTWTYPATDKLLFSAGATVLIARYHNQAPSIAPPRNSSMISVIEQTGLAGGATAGFRYIAPANTNRDTQR